MPQDGDDLLSADEIIEYLVRHRRLRRMALTCVLPAIRVGAEWRFRRSDLAAWVEEQGERLEPGGPASPPDADATGTDGAAQLTTEET